MTAAIHLAKATQPEEYEVLPTLIPDTWGGEGKVTPMERAAATEFMGKYIDQAYAASPVGLGSPTSGYLDALRSPRGTTGKYRIYQNGTVHWSSQYGAVALWFDVPGGVYAQNGGSGGWLGFPTKPEYNWNGGRRTDFEGGYIFWDGRQAKAYRFSEQPQPIPNVPINSSSDNYRKATPGQSRQYIVQSGDTLWSIAQRLLGNGNRWREIMKTPTGGTFTDAEARSWRVGQSVYLPVSYQSGSGTPQTPPPSSTPGTNSNINWVNFSGTVGPSIGVNLRNSPRFSDRSSRNEPKGKRLEFDAWTYGETGTDLWLGTPDARWFKVKGTNLWVPSAYIYGNPPSSSPAPTSKPGYVNASEGLNFRTSPSTSASIIRRLANGTNLTILERVSGSAYAPGNRTDWYKVKVGNTVGYVAAYYVKEGSNNGGGGKYTPINSYSEYLKRLYGPNSSGRITQNANAHGGAIDSGNGLGSNLYALVGGEVIEARNGVNFGANSCKLSNWTQNGTVAIFNKEMNKTFIYWHLQEGSIDQSMKGKTIPTGSFIGKEGKTGYACGTTGVHTHVEVHEGRVNINMALGQLLPSSTKLYLPSVLGNTSW